MVLNFCFSEYAKANIAENFTQPVDYFWNGSPVRKLSIWQDPTDEEVEGATLVVFGGGGIQPKAWRRIRDLVECFPPWLLCVIWGMGINDHGRFDQHYPAELAWLEARPNVRIGLRDRFYRKYVPCASCMHPKFETVREVHRPLGLYVHHLYDLELDGPRLTNVTGGDVATSFSAVLDFLGSSEVVVTNTYHGAYWATLLGRRAVVVSPFSNKFFGFPFEPLVFQDCATLAAVGMPALIELAPRYPDALAQCRSINFAFHRLVICHSLEFSRRRKTSNLPRR